VARSLKSETELFLDKRGHTFLSFAITTERVPFRIALASLDTSEMNVKLHRANRLMNEMFDKMAAFERKLRLSKLQLRSNDKTLFPILRREKPNEAKKLNSSKRRQFLFSRYKQIRGYNQFSGPSDDNVETAPAEFQTEMTDLQYDRS